MDSANLYLIFAIEVLFVNRDLGQKCYTIDSDIITVAKRHFLERHSYMLWLILKGRVAGESMPGWGMTSAPFQSITAPLCSLETYFVLLRQRPDHANGFPRTKIMVFSE